MYLVKDELLEQKNTLKKMGNLLKKKESELVRKDIALEKKDAALEMKDFQLKNSARILLEAGISVQRIAESTGLSIIEIEKIRKSIN